MKYNDYCFSSLSFVLKHKTSHFIKSCLKNEILIIEAIQYFQHQFCEYLMRVFMKEIKAFLKN